MIGRRQKRPWSRRALLYFRSHAISVAVASRAGVYERKGCLVYPVRCRDGHYYERRQPLSGRLRKRLQPRGERLHLYWPQGPMIFAPRLLICEGESDALAALSAWPEKEWGMLPVAAIPGLGYPPQRLLTELGWVEAQIVYLALDNDAPSRAYVDEVSWAMREVGIDPRVIELPVGCDLADTLVSLPSQDRHKVYGDVVYGADYTL